MNRENQLSTPVHLARFDDTGKLQPERLINTDILFNLLTYQNVGKDLTCDTTIKDGLVVPIKLFYIVLVLKSF